MSRRRWFCAAVGIRHGLAWVRVLGRGLSLRAPWNRPLFSERNGLRKPILSKFGWRLFVLSHEVANGEPT